MAVLYQLHEGCFIASSAKCQFLVKSFNCGRQEGHAVTKDLLSIPLDSPDVVYGRVGYSPLGQSTKTSLAWKKADVFKIHGDNNADAHLQLALEIA